MTNNLRLASYFNFILPINLHKNSRKKVRNLKELKKREKHSEVVLNYDFYGIFLNAKPI